MPSYFNSIKVRLEQKSYLSSLKTYLFQFHKGAIRTKCLHPVKVKTLRFQFHKGAIRTHLLLSRKVPFHHFNSIKVRLERIGRIGHHIVLQFQFHKGAIRTGNQGYDFHIAYSFQFHKGAIRTFRFLPNCLIFLDFNSIKVRLEPKLLGVDHIDRIIISIP